MDKGSWDKPVTIANSNNDVYYLWTDANGALRWKASPPLSDTDGQQNTTYVVRDAIARDFDTWTADASWKVDSLDLSSIVPAGAVAVHVYVEVKATAANMTFILRKDATNLYNRIRIQTYQANVEMQLSEIIAIDPSDRLLDYYGVVATWTFIYVTVLGWITPYS